MPALQNFTSAVELSCALNLAYTVLGDIHNFQAKKLERRMQRIDAAAASSSTPAATATELKGHHNDARIALNGASLKVERAIGVYVRISTGVAILGVIVLIWSGFAPATEIGPVWMGLLLIVLFAPFPYFVLRTRTIGKADYANCAQSVLSGEKVIDRAFEEKFGRQ